MNRAAHIALPGMSSLGIKKSAPSSTYHSNKHGDFWCWHTGKLMQYIYKKGMLSSFLAGQASAKLNSRLLLNMYTLISSPWIYFGQKQRFFISADAYNPCLFLNSMVSFKTKNPRSNKIILVADPHIVFESRSKRQTVIPPRLSNSWFGRNQGASFPSTISLQTLEFLFCHSKLCRILHLQMPRVSGNTHKSRTGTPVCPWCGHWFNSSIYNVSSL